MSTIERAQSTVNYHGETPVTARNADLGRLAEILREQHARKIDVVAPASAIRAEGGLLRITGSEPVLGRDGVSVGDGLYRPTAVADEGLAYRLGIPTAYLKRMRAERPDLYDANVNGWLHGVNAFIGGPAHRQREAVDPDSRSFLVRAFRGNGTEGVARAVLSDRYRIVDNLDVLMATLDGIRQSGAEVEIESADLTDRRMYVRVGAPAIRDLAPDLLGDYRSPFSGQTGTDNPVVFAGFVVSNSETGGGAFTITPRVTIEVCRNGMTISKDAMRNVHLGGRLEEGVVRWSDETQQRNLDLVTSQARDAVETFLDAGYVRRVLDRLRAEGGREVEEPAKVVETVGKALKYGEEATSSILDHFIRGGSTTALGVAQAVTSYAQTIDDADRAAEIEDSALDAMTLAAR